MKPTLFAMLLAREHKDIFGSCFFTLFVPDTKLYSLEQLKIQASNDKSLVETHIRSMIVFINSECFHFYSNLRCFNIARKVCFTNHW